MDEERVNFAFIKEAGSFLRKRNSSLNKKIRHYNSKPEEEFESKFDYLN